jgi:hypothetical protein
MMDRFRSLFTKRGAIGLGLIVAIVAAGIGWKMGSGEAIGRYLTAPVTLVAIEEKLTALGAL